MAFQTKSSVLALIKEDTEGTLKYPASGSDFTVLREGFTFESGVETVDSDELVNDIGASKAFLAKETPSGSTPKYFKHSGVEGQEPDYGIMVESAMGSVEIHAEETTTAGSTAGTTAVRATIEVADTSSMSKGQALMVKDATNGYQIRNIQEVIDGNDAALNFNVATAPGSGVLLGQAIHYSPVATGHPTYSAHLYQAGANSAYHQAQTGVRTTSMSMEFPANDLASFDVDFEGIEFFYNPVSITSSNKFIDFTDDGGTAAAILTEKSYKTGEDFRAEVESKLNAAGTDTFTVAFDTTTGKYTISADGAVLSLLWNTGVNTANSAAGALGFSTVADDTAALTYDADSAQDYDPAFTPVYDDKQPNIVRFNELTLGDFGRFDCRNGSTANFSVSTPKTDLDDFCAESGTSESLTLEREVTFTATLYLKKHEACDFNTFIANGDSSVMFNHGEKDAAKNWKPGTCVNVYVPKMSLTAYTVADSDGIQVIEIEGKGFVTSAEKDLYINFL